MMSGHGGNPIFFNKKIKIGRPEQSLTPHPLRPITPHFCLIPPLKVDVISISPPKKISESGVLMRTFL